MQKLRLVLYYFFGTAFITLLAQYYYLYPKSEVFHPLALWMFGLVSVVSASILGAAVGIYTTGVSIIGAGVLKPKILHRNLISIIFCEAVAIYGLITALFLVDNRKNIQTKYPDVNWYNACIVFGAGVTTGFVNLFGGMAVGSIGSGTALADAAERTTFVKNILVAIFASVIGLYGLIVGIYIVAQVHVVV